MSGKIPKSLQKILPTAKRMMSRKTFVQGIKQQAALDKKSPLSQRMAKRMAVAEMTEAPLPGLRKQQLDYMDLQEKAFGRSANVTSREAAIRMYAKGTKAAAASEEKPKEAAPEEKRRQERLAEVERKKAEAAEARENERLKKRTHEYTVEAYAAERDEEARQEEEEEEKKPVDLQID